MQSVGLHEPCALPYLVDEAFLPRQSSEASYRWHVHAVYNDAGDELAEDEIVQTNKCVVWSRGGVVKRAFNLDVEDEEILQSFVSRFSASEGLPRGTHRAESLHVSGQRRNMQTSDDSPRDIQSTGQRTDEALVVIMRTKAHVYYVTGGSHIISVPFEIAAAFPTPRGFILQRKAFKSAADPGGLSAPQNSFVSSQFSNSLTRSQPVALKAASNARPSLTLSPVARHIKTSATAHESSISSLWSLTDPQTGLGVAVRESHSRTGSRIESTFDPAEEILYVSREDEIAAFRVVNVEPLLLAVTCNTNSGTFTVWKVRYRNRDCHDPHPKRKKLSHEFQAGRRRSSNIVKANGSTTPIGRGLGDSRESFGPHWEGRFQKASCPITTMSIEPVKLRTLPPTSALPLQM